MKKPYVGALDQGTTSSRFILFDSDGSVVSSDQREHRQIFPEPGWVEHDPEEIWGNTCLVIRGALEKGNVSPADIAAIGITNQRETTLCWNRRTGKPYGNAIVWQDTRTREICTELASRGGIDRFRGKTGLPLATYFSAPKIQWLLSHVPALREDAEKGEALFGNMDAWLIWRLTGGTKGGRHLTDVTNASRTLLFNLHSLAWDDDLLTVFSIPRSMLPEVRPSIDTNLFGETDPEGPFERGIPISGVLGDQQSALFGQCCFEPGETKNTYGTGCFMLSNTGQKPVASKHGLLSTVAFKNGELPPVYALEGSVAVAGALVQWLRDNLGIIRSSAEVETLASKVPNNGGVYYVPAFSGLFAPYWRSDARGIVAGLTHSSSKAHIARAVLEATAFQTKEIFDAMEKDSGGKIPSLRVDGGMVANELLMQFQADILDIPVSAPEIRETTALGAAFSAGLAVGIWSSLEELKSIWRLAGRWESRMSRKTRQELTRCWRKAVKRTFGWLDE